MKNRQLKKIIWVISLSIIIIVLLSLPILVYALPNTDEKNNDRVFKEKIYKQEDAENGNNKTFSIYEENDKEIIYDDNNNMAGYVEKNQSSKKESIKSPSLSEDEIKNIAQNELKKHVDIEHYHLTDFSYNKSLKTYSITYHRLISGYKSSDFILINLSNKGDVISYAAPNCHSFDSITLPKIDETFCETELINYINKEFKNQFKSYKITDKILVLDGNTLYLQLSYSIILNDNTTTANTYLVKLKDL